MEKPELGLPADCRSPERFLKPIIALSLQPPLLDPSRLGELCESLKQAGTIDNKLASADDSCLAFES